MQLRALAFLGLTLAAHNALAKDQWVEQPLRYAVGDTAVESVLLYDGSVDKPRPGLIIVPNWMGINEANLRQARQIVGDDYVGLVVDMYGTATRPQNPKEAGAAAGAVKGDTEAMRARIVAALAQLQAQSQAPLEAQDVGAIGFCFGGTVVLELARLGAAVDGVVSFHGGLATKAPAAEEAIQAKVLVLHGADDPYVPPAEVEGFIAEMKAARADWSLVSYGNAVHSFTDPDANLPGQAQYNPVVAKRAYAAMDDFFAEAFAGE